MLVLAISAVGAFAVFLLLHFFVKTHLVPETQMHQRLRKLKYGSQVQTERETAKTLSDVPFVERTIAPIFRSITEFLLLFAPQGVHERLEHRIMLAGKQGGGLERYRLCLRLGIVCGRLPFVGVLSVIGRRFALHSADCFVCTGGRRRSAVTLRPFEFNYS